MGVYWLASYPKSGNTWVRALLSAYLQPAGDAFDPDTMSVNLAFARRSLIDDLLGLPSADLYAAEFDRLHPLACRQLAEDVGAEPCFVKTHSALWTTADGVYAFPPEATAGVIHIVRNPLDVAVSFAAFLGLRIPRTIRLLNKPTLHLNPDTGSRRDPMTPELLRSWSGHALSWLDATAHRTLLVRYEDLLADPAAAFEAVLRFAGYTPDPARLQAAVDATRFERLQAHEAAEGFRERPPTASAFFRKGRAGDWRRVLTPEQAVQVVTDHQAVMRRLGYGALVDEVLAGP